MIPPAPARAKHVSIPDLKTVVVTLDDGREVRFPRDDFPLLRQASPVSLHNVRMIAGGLGLRWDSADEDLEVAFLVARYGTQRRPVDPG